MRIMRHTERMSRQRNQKRKREVGELSSENAVIEAGEKRCSVVSEAMKRPNERITVMSMESGKTGINGSLGQSSFVVTLRTEAIL